MRSVIYDWKNRSGVRTPRNCHWVLRPRARLIMIDQTYRRSSKPQVDHLAAILIDLNMLCGPGGYERTQSEHRGPLAKGGLRMTWVVPADRYNVIQGTVVSPAEGAPRMKRERAFHLVCATRF